jgi:hypothetical protein
MAPHDVAPHISTEMVNLTGILTSELLEGFRQRLGENYGKTNELGKTEYN